MGKDKKRKISDAQKKETMFYYEVMGVILIIISSVLILQLGQIGSWLYILFKILFGDYYFIFVFLMMFIGFYSLFFHKAFNLKNQKFIGFIFMGIGIMIFCHIPVHNYVITKEGNYFSNTWSIYYSYLTVGYGDVLGGGIIGAIIFYLSYVMFGLIGVCLIAVVIIILGFSLFINKSIGELVIFIIDRMKGIKSASKSFNNFFKYELGPKDNKPHNIFNSKKQLPLKILKDNESNLNISLQHKISEENKNTINSILNNLQLEYKEVEMLISFNTTTYKYIIFSDFDQLTLIKKLKNVIDEKILFGKNNNKVIIQINNNHYEELSLKKILQMQNSLIDNLILPIGCDTNNKLIELDVASHPGILVLSSSSDFSYKLIIDIFIMLIIKKPLCSYEFYLFDDLSNKSKYEDLIHNIFKVNDDNLIIDYLVEIKKYVDIVLQELENEKVNNIYEYNKKQEANNHNSKYKTRVYYINLERVSDYREFEELVFYILTSSKKTGVFMVLSIYQDSVSNVLLSLFEHKIFYRNNLYNNPYPNTKCLVCDNDALLITGVKENRITIPSFSEDEFLKIKKYID